MNIQQAKNISIKSIMESFSLFPSKGNDRTAFYFALDREERTPSLSVNFVGNTAFDFGTGKKFDNVSLVQAIKQCSISDALKYIAGLDHAFAKEKITLERETSFEILTIKDLEHPALIQYLYSRKINFETHYLLEIHYEISGKKYFGIAFENNSGGIERRLAFEKELKSRLSEEEIECYKSLSKYADNFRRISNLFKIGDVTVMKQETMEVGRLIREHLKKFQ